ncbi:uncharacterized protein LOC130564569 [Triplophysa rosa]|uniref:uncharacterized protein LOC130564569 n=1 Tax=Triplophysa rosa TaxID=992332 RepID=UPI0025460308|nr:uncharacterized protein LOC130564569 [Triplophysa rosa]
MMNLSLKVNDIKIEVSSELGVNSGLDIHLVLQNDPTSSAGNREKIILEISRAQTNPSTSEDVVEEVFSEATDQLPQSTESEHPDSEEEIYYDATDQLPQFTESEYPDSEEEIHYDASDQFTLNLPESDRPEEEIHSEATDQLPQNVESHYHRVLSEEQRSAQIANLRLETSLTLLYDLTSSCTGIQRFTTFCFIPWRDILNEIVEARLPLEIKNNLWRMLKELYRLAMKIDRLSENRQALLYRHLSPKFDRLFAWLCQLIWNQSPQILNEVRQNILRIRRSVRIFSLYLQTAWD